MLDHRSRWRRTLLLVAALCGAALGSDAANAQRRWGCRAWTVPDNDPPSTEVVVARWRYGTNGLIGNCGWSHNYPYSEENLNGFVTQTTRVDIEPLSYRLLDLGSAEIFEYPFTYISEPGEMELTDREVANLREYIERGGFIVIDDFDNNYDDHMANLRAEMRRVFPEHHFEQLSGDHPIFDLIYEVKDLETMGRYMSGRAPVYYALMNSQGEVAIIALLNNDLANFWEWYGNPGYPLAPATEAFRMGVNFLLHSMTH